MTAIWWLLRVCL